MNNNIRWYSLTTDSETQDNEIVDYDKACKIIDEYVKSAKNKENLVKCSSCSEEQDNGILGFFVDGNANSFVEIGIDTGDKFRIKFEYAGDSKKFLIFSFGLYQKEYFVNNVDDLKNIIKNFYDKNLGEFKSYFDSLSYKVDRRR